MNLNEIINRSKEIFREVFDDDEIDITPETTAEDIEEWDSLSHMRLIVAHEIDFGIKFSVNEIDSLNNVNDFHNLILEKIKSNE
ncbi:acyl carrier protein [Candidatus Pelagibacter sp. HIMB1695]|uniref:acyl carrier protein n=1 Tax=Candidatus Pelagibacter sp. HIMB1695 TaxID=3413364 RepID=UPI003F834BA5